MLKVKKR